MTKELPFRDESPPEPVEDCKDDCGKCKKQHKGCTNW